MIKPYKPGPLALSPEAEKRRERYDELSDEFIKLVSEREELVGTVIPNVEAEYQLKIGRKEYELFCLKVEISRIKRKIDLVQACVNRGQKADLKVINGQLDEEFEQWRKDMEELGEKVKRAEAFHDADKMSAKAAERLRSLFRSMVRQLHPDINPDWTEEAKHLWMRVVEAYERADLKELEVLATLVEGELGTRNEYMSPISDQKCEALEGKVKGLIDEIGKLKAKHPMPLCEKLEDEEWVRGRQGELDAEIGALGEEKRKVEKWLASLSQSL